jgi:hypothetical protein
MLESFSFPSKDSTKNRFGCHPLFFSGSSQTFSFISTRTFAWTLRYLPRSALQVRTIARYNPMSVGQTGNLCKRCDGVSGQFPRNLQSGSFAHPRLIRLLAVRILFGSCLPNRRYSYLTESSTKLDLIGTLNAILSFCCPSPCNVVFSCIIQRYIMAGLS